MRAFLSSHRRRRRLAWASGILLVVGSLVALGVLYPNTVESEETFGRGEVKRYVEPKTVRLDRKERARALATAANFVRTAVVRQHVERSWDLTAPSLKRGFTREEWRHGNIPVVPYPVAEARWRLDYSYADALGLQVLVFPKAKSGLRPNLFLMELKRVGHGDDRRWLVDSWVPNGTQAPPSRAALGGGGVVAGAPLASAAGGGGEGVKARLGAAWLLVPLGVLGIVPLVLAGFALRSWLGNRRAMRLYAESKRSLPDLPSYRSPIR